jgi:uncharacterized membrane protein
MFFGLRFSHFHSFSVIQVNVFSVNLLHLRLLGFRSTAAQRNLKWAFHFNTNVCVTVVLYPVTCGEYSGHNRRLDGVMQLGVS